MALDFLVVTASPQTYYVLAPAVPGVEIFVEVAPGPPVRTNLDVQSVVGTFGSDIRSLIRRDGVLKAVERDHVVAFFRAAHAEVHRIDEFSLSSLMVQSRSRDMARRTGHSGRNNAGFNTGRRRRRGRRQTGWRISREGDQELGGTENPPDATLSLLAVDPGQGIAGLAYLQFLYTRSVDLFDSLQKAWQRSQRGWRR